MLVLTTLGKSAIELGASRVLPSAARKFALLLYLAMERGRRIPRAALRDLIFPDQTEPNSRHSLRELVYQFRRANLRIESDPSTIELPSSEVRCDIDDFASAD